MYSGRRIEVKWSDEPTLGSMQVTEVRIIKYRGNGRVLVQGEGYEGWRNAKYAQRTREGKITVHWEDEETQSILQERCVRLKVSDYLGTSPQSTTMMLKRASPKAMPLSRERFEIDGPVVAMRDNRGFITS